MWRLSRRALGKRRSPISPAPYAEVIVVGGRVFVASSVQFAERPGRSTLEFQEVPWPESAVGAAVMKALSDFRHGVAVAETVVPSEELALRATGLPTMASVRRIGEVIAVTLRPDGSLSIAPWDWRGDSTDMDRATSLPDCRDLASVGAAILGCARESATRAGPEVDLALAQAQPVATAVGGRGFGYKCAWLALRSVDGVAVLTELGAVDARPVGWEEGLEASRDTTNRLVFVSPPVSGWTLVVLSPVLTDAANAGSLIDLASLSVVFGECQKFATHRVVEHHEWQRWLVGAPARRYCYVGERGEVLFDEGESAVAEGRILRAGEPPEAAEAPDESTVLGVAAEWSLDPSRLDAVPGVADFGHLAAIPS